LTLPDLLSLCRQPENLKGILAQEESGHFVVQAQRIEILKTLSRRDMFNFLISQLSGKKCAPRSGKSSQSGSALKGHQ
jgi:hypothetical protein